MQYLVGETSLIAALGYHRAGMEGRYTHHHFPSLTLPRYLSPSLAHCKCAVFEGGSNLNPEMPSPPRRSSSPALLTVATICHGARMPTTRLTVFLIQTVLLFVLLCQS